MAAFVVNNTQIVGSALALGEIEHDIDAEPWYYDNDPGLLKRLKKTIGLEKRFTTSESSTTADLCLEATQSLLEALHYPKSSIDAVLFVTQTPDYTMPGNAHVVHQRLHLPITTAAYDLAMGCSGFIHGLSFASALLNQGLSAVLLLTGDTLSHRVDPTDRSIAPLFGDAGSATLLINKKDAAPMYFMLGADGQGLEKMYAPQGGSRNPSGTANVYMDGFGIFQFSMTRQPEVLSDSIRFANLSIDDIDYFLLHQANRYIVETITQKAGIAASKTPSDIFTKFGNLNSASIPAILCAAFGDNLAHTKKRVLMQAFGVGLSWGSCITVLDHVLCLPPIHFGGTRV